VKSYNGIVDRIDLRYTVLRSDSKEIYVPNSILFTDAITVERKSDPLPATAAVEQGD